MTINHRFSISKEHGRARIIDKLNPANDGEGHYFEGDPADDMHLRECVLRRRLSDLLHDLIVNTNPMKKDLRGEEYQPYNEECGSIWWTLFEAIKASHLNTLDVALSIQCRFGGEIKRKKVGWQHVTSLSRFVDDVEHLLRDIYGESDNQAIDRVRSAVFVIVKEFTKYLRRDLWQEHQDAVNVDYMCGIGVPEGYCLSGGDHRRGHRSAHDLELRARAVRVNPAAFSKYTVEFVNELFRSWRRLAQSTEDADTGLDNMPLEEVPF